MGNTNNIPCKQRMYSLEYPKRPLSTNQGYDFPFEANQNFVSGLSTVFLDAFLDAPYAFKLVGWSVGDVLS